MKNQQHSCKGKLLSLICTLLLLAGCSSAPQAAINGEKWQSDWTKIGVNIGVDVPEPFTLLDNKEALAADGLYYATWAAGDSASYENKDGDTIDLYDAQLYFLASEAADEEAAKRDYSTWLSAAKKNYQVQTEDIINCNGQAYTLITYRCTGEDNPYDHGVSAFGTNGVNAVCAEFICLETYTEDLEVLLTEFLNGCHYRAE